MRPLPFLVLLLLAGVLAVSAAPNPAVAPTLPSSPPPSLTSLGNPGSGNTEGVQVPAGWSMLSFSLGSLDGLDGLSHAPMWYAGGQFQPVTSLPLDPGLGYLVYGDAPGTVQASGQPNQGQLQASWLRAGWNLIGCPSTAPLPLSRLVLSRPGGTLDVLEGSADPSPTPGSAWLYSAATASYRGASSTVDLRDPNAALRPGQVTWVFAWHDAQLYWNVDPPNPPPQITSLSSPALAQGEVLEIDGQGFGPTGTGLVTLNGHPVQPEDVVDWAPGRIRLKIPAAASAGPILVFAHGCPSNRVPFQVIPRELPTTGALTGLVQADDGTPLAGAEVMTDDGHQVVTNSRGLFTIDRLTAGAHQVYISLMDYRSGRGQVQITAGQTRRLQVVLTPTSEADAPPPAQGAGAAPASPEQTTTMHVTAYPYTLSHSRFWVKSIEVSEYGNYSRRWSKYWDTDVGDARFDLNCPGALVGRSYNIRITWRDRLGVEKEDMWQPELQKADGTFYYYHPD